MLISILTNFSEEIKKVEKTDLCPAVKGLSKKQCKSAKKCSSNDQCAIRGDDKSVCCMNACGFKSCQGKISNYKKFCYVGDHIWDQI